jgi:hypothetical protein
MGDNHALAMEEYHVLQKRHADLAGCVEENTRAAD